MSENHCSAGLQLGDQHEDAPQAVDDGRHGGQQLDEDRQRLAQPPRAQLGDVERGRDGDRHADHERDGRRDERADHAAAARRRCSFETSQLLSKTKPTKPNLSNAGLASM